ncbi:type III PLP-dependent enzyme [Candidatus Dojkabacteria bacterium]|uniref:Type III PLP-dependent enzyme n=1 Tax=Candidatus Dojkabacteria bacterium TaxID=2099670 RepID=A0A955I080_9BACT|nr:type III PLP-dependent enzyme [Candidatus Dojkabacteria bacterium]MCB9790944.1 type III PLP-dependent enzyme [Candidatus Nomurabacteria bacterium]
MSNLKDYFQADKTPVLFIDGSKVRQNCRNFKRSFPSATFFYSVKANSSPNVLKLIFDQGFGFDVASVEEIKQLLSFGVPAERIVFSAPTKIPSHIEYAFRNGIRVFSFDSDIEIEKIARLAPGSNLIGRIGVNNKGSEWPLVGKFGIPDSDIVRLYKFALEKGLTPAGVSFHVGSQNKSPQAWSSALDKMSRVVKELKESSIRINIINIGGGFPVEYVEEVPDLSEYSKEINKSFESLFGYEEFSLYIEPGRSVVGNTGYLVVEVINRSYRDGENWLYIDVGAYHGLQETLEGFKYKVAHQMGDDKCVEYTIAGASCDSTDSFMKGTLLPESLGLGDRLIFLNTGAYTTSYEYYNGLRFPETVVS